MSNFRLRFKVEVCERSSFRPRDWREEWLSVNVVATDRQTAFEMVQRAVQTLVTEGFPHEERPESEGEEGSDYDDA